MFEKFENYRMNLRDYVAVRNSFNPPKSFCPSTKDKYGSGNHQEIFNENCTEGVKLVVDTIRKLRASDNINLATTKEALKQLLEKLSGIRKDTAVVTGTLNPENFGRSRKNDPIIPPSGQTVVDMTRIHNEQHKAAHNAIKKLLGPYLPGVFQQQKPFGFQAIANDPSGRSRYTITIYEQSHLRFIPRNPHEATITLETTDNNSGEIQRLARNPNYTPSPIYRCTSDINHIWSDLSGNFPTYYKKCIVVGEVQLKFNNQFITGTRHISWFNNTMKEFNSESKISLQHMSSDHHEVVFNKVAELWLEALLWEEGTNNTTQLNTIMADLQFYFGQALFFYRGSPTICKMLMNGTYYEQGFLPQPEVSETDTYCTAEYFPFIDLYRKKFLACYATLPTSVRTQEFIRGKGKFSAVEEAANEKVETIQRIDSTL